MSKACRLRAKGEVVNFDTEDGDKEYTIKPLKNEQLLELQELWDKKDDQKSQNKANILFIKYSLNRDPNIISGKDKNGEFTDEEVADMETNFMIQIMEKAAKVNGLEQAMSFQKKNKMLDSKQENSSTSPTKEINRRVLS